MYMDYLYAHKMTLFEIYKKKIIIPQKKDMSGLKILGKIFYVRYNLIITFA